MAEKKITKQEAVRQSLEKLGNAAKPTAIQTDVRDRFGFDMTLNHIKTAKRKALLKGAGPDRPASDGPAAKKAEAAAPAAEKISKREAVRRSLARLGEAATLKELQADIRERFGFEMSTNHISTSKGELRKMAAAGWPAAKKPTAGKREARKEAVTSLAGSAPAVAAANGTAIPLEDILAVKALVGRVGAEQLRTLIDAFAR